MGRGRAVGTGGTEQRADERRAEQAKNGEVERWITFLSVSRKVQKCQHRSIL